MKKLVEIFGLNKEEVSNNKRKITRLSSRELQRLILQEEMSILVEKETTDLDDEKKQSDEPADKEQVENSIFTDEEAVEAIEKNIPGQDVTTVVDFLNSPLGTDPKVRHFLRQGTADGEPGDEEISVGSETPAVGGMIPTQNEIDLMKSISYPLSDKGSLDNSMQSTVEIGDIIASGEHIIDGHHRWSSVAAINPGANLKVIDLGLPGDADKKLAVAQIAIASQPEVGVKPVPKATTGGAANNILGKGAGEIKTMILDRVGEPSEAGELLNDDITNHFKEMYSEKFGIEEDDDMATVREKVATTVGENLAAMKKGEGPERSYMPQFTGGDTGPKLDASNVMKTLSTGDTNYKEPVRKDESVVLERWQKLAGILKS